MSEGLDSMPPRKKRDGQGGRPATDPAAGFTLVELLAVIALVLILISLLLPLLETVRRRAHKVVCASGERQMAVAFNSYKAENEGNFPFHRRGMMESWHSEIAPFLSLHYDLFRCPARPIWFSNLYPGRTYPICVTNPLAQHFMPYGYNGHWLGLDEYAPNSWQNPSGRNRTRDSDIQNPAHLMVVTDSKLSRYDTWGQSIWYPYRRDNEGVGDTHEGQANVLFADGHVSAHPADLLNEAEEYRAWWIPNARWDPGY